MDRMLLVAAAVVAVVFWMLSRRRDVPRDLPTTDASGWLVVYARRPRTSLREEIGRVPWDLSTPGFGRQSLLLQQHYEQQGCLDVRVVFESDGLTEWTRRI